jgi:arylsulfatase A-like enzyme
MNPFRCHLLAAAVLGCWFSAAADLTRPIAGPDLVFEEHAGLVAVEAEHFYKQTLTEKRAWYLTSPRHTPNVLPDGDPPHLEGASGGAYLEILPDTRRTHADPLVPGENFSNQPGRLAVLHYRVHFNEPGRYFVWVRAYSTGTEDNGIHVGLNGHWPASGQRLQWCDGKNSWRWESRQRTEREHCGEPHLIHLDIPTAGEHEVQFSMREDGFAFDRFLLTTNRDFARPEGSGPPARVRAGAPPVAGFSAKPRPNIILVMTDDQGYGDVGAHGNTLLRTPHLDRLHGESVRLTDFHVDPTCSPTRAALLTGRYATRTGVWHTVMGRSLLAPEETTLADVLAANGYRTGIIGKWHLGDNFPLRPQDRGFEEVLIHGGGGIGQTPDYWGNDYFDDHFLDHDGNWRPFAGYCTDVFFDEALRFLERERGRPFFLYLATNVPHGPFRVPGRHRQHYLDRGVPEPMASFYGMIENFDDNLGRLRARLQELGLADNTIFLFLTDNGTAAGAPRAVPADQTPPAWNGFNAGMRAQKGSAYEGGHRVPCFLHWPAGGLAEGRDVNRLTAHFDLLPTLVDLAGLEFTPKLPLDGRSLAPLLRDLGADGPDRTLFVHVQREEIPPKWRNSAVLFQHWRLVNGTELYDLRADPGQQLDVAAAQPDIIARLRTEYEAWWRGLEPAFDRLVPLVVGAAEENPTVLNCMDWHAPTVREIPWDQSHVEALPAVNGWWWIDVARAGRYEVTLRHRPAGAEIPLRATTARVKIGEVEAQARVTTGASTVTFSVDLPAGPARLETFLSDEAAGETRGAFFVEFLRPAA